MTKFAQTGQSQGSDLNPVPPKYEELHLVGHFKVEMLLCAVTNALSQGANNAHGSACPWQQYRSSSLYECRDIS